jgi:hypothetical protein
LTRGGIKTIDRLDFSEELNFLKNFLKDYNIKFLSTPATVEHFGASLVLNPTIIQFSGHGNFTT